jgi:phosphate acetyltransferase
LDVVETSKASIRDRGLKVALPEGEDERILQAAQRLSGAGLARPVIMGRPAEVQARAAALGVQLEGCAVRDPASDGALATYAAHIASGRDKMTAGMAERMLRRPLYFAGAMVAAGDAAAMVAGVANPTRRVIEAGLLTIGLAPGIATPSSFFLMLVPGATAGDRRAYIFADCAINAEPSAQELAAIAITSAESAKSLLVCEPRVALLSFSTHGSASHPRVDKVRAALETVRRLRPDLAIDGELQGDAAVSPVVAAKKMHSLGEVAGRANVLIFPDLDSGNIAYKLVQHLGGATAIGPFLQGFAKPISDLSRGASVDDIVATVAVALARSLR